MNRPSQPWTGNDVLLDKIELEACAEGVRALANAVRGLDFEYRQFRQRVATAHGISIAEFDALSAVAWGEGDITPKRVAEVTNLSTGAMTAMLDRLAAAGLLQRNPHPTDRRSLVIDLTPAGEELVGEIYRSYVHAFDSVAVGRTPSEMRALIDSLGSLAVAVSHADEELPAARGRHHLASTR